MTANNDAPRQSPSEREPEQSPKIPWRQSTRSSVPVFNDGLEVTRGSEC